MSLLKLMNKYGIETKVSKTSLYKNVMQEEGFLKENNCSCSVKSYDDLFKLEMILKGLHTKILIEETYNKFVSANFDTFDYINYEEKRKMLQRDIDQAINDSIFFLDKKSNKAIYIPYYELFVNERIKDDYLVLTLKQYENYIKNYKIDKDNINKLYGLQPYNSEFSSLILMGQDDEYEYFYLPETKHIYIYDKANACYYNELALVDSKSKHEPSIDEVRELITLFIEDDNDELFVQTLKEKEFISEKIANKIIKKLQKEKK